MITKFTDTYDVSQSKAIYLVFHEPEFDVDGLVQDCSNSIANA